MKKGQTGQAVAAISVLSLLALAACSGSGSTSTGNENSTSAPAAQGTTSSAASNSPSQRGVRVVGQDPTRKPPAPPVPGAKKGGTLTVLAFGGINTLDPTGAYSLFNLSILNGLVTRSLTQHVFNPKTGKDVLIPDLAVGLGKPNKDFTKWTFTLRKGIKYGNGNPVKPADYKYAIERSFDRDAFPAGASYSNQYFLNGDTYTGPYRKDKGKDYKGVVIHGNKMTIKMSQPFPGMSDWGSYAAMGPIPAGKVSNPSTYGLHPLATGPYKFKSYQPKHKLVLVKNPYWDPNTDPGRRQLLDKYVFKLDLPQSQIDQIILADNGAGKTSVSLTSVLAADYHTFKTQAPDRLASGPVPCTFYWAPDNRKITDVRVRRAIGWALPYEDALVARGRVPKVNATPPWNPTPPGVAGRVQFNPLPGHKPWSTNPAKAKALLKQAGALGQVLKFPYSTDDPQSVNAKDVLVKAFKEAGFDPQPIATTTKTDYKLIQNPKADVNMRYIEWCPDWPRFGSFLPVIFHSTNIKKDGLGANFEAFESNKVDKQMSKIIRMPRAQQAAAWNKLEKNIMLKHYPIVPTQYAATTLMRGSKVHNLYVDPWNGAPTWKIMWVG